MNGSPMVLFSTLMTLLLAWVNACKKSGLIEVKLGLNYVMTYSGPGLTAFFYAHYRQTDRLT